MITIRQAVPTDAAAFLALKTALDGETSLMTIEPGERTTTVEQERIALEALIIQDNSTVLVAEVGGEHRRHWPARCRIGMIISGCEESGAAAALSWGRTVQVKLLHVIIPIVAVVSSAAIGIGIGLINLEMRHAFDSAVAPVVSAGALTIAIMLVAAYLHMQSPDPE